MGGIAIRTPATWRVESNVKTLAGGVDAGSPSEAEPDAPVLTLEGTVLLGGVSIGPKSEHEDRQGPKYASRHADVAQLVEHQLPSEGRGFDPRRLVFFFFFFFVSLFLA